MMVQPRVEGNTVIIDVKNDLMIREINAATDLLQFLRSQTNRPDLNIQGNKTEENLSKDVVYTAREKLAAMIEDNPDVQYLVDELKLHTIGF